MNERTAVYFSMSHLIPKQVDANTNTLPTVSLLRCRFLGLLLLRLRGCFLLEFGERVIFVVARVSTEEGAASGFVGLQDNMGKTKGKNESRALLRIDLVEHVFI